jgi:hypothetical protein
MQIQNLKWEQHLLSFYRKTEHLFQKVRFDNPHHKLVDLINGRKPPLAMNKS